MYLLFDIGGTSTRVAAAHDRELLKVVSYKTPKSFVEGVRVFEELGKKLLGGARPKIVSGGIAGVVDREFGVRGYSPNLKGWIGKPLVAEMKKIFKCQVLLENDAALAGLGETHFGAAKSKKIVAYITVGTGVGGVRIVDGKIDARAYGFEPGAEILLRSAGWRMAVQNDRKNQTLEDLVSGAAILQTHKKEPKDIKDRKFWEEQAWILAIGLHNITVMWSPDVIVLGGGLVLDSSPSPNGQGYGGRSPLSLERVRFHFKKISHVFPKLPEIKKAALGDRSGLYGAICAIEADKH